MRETSQHAKEYRQAAAELGRPIVRVRAAQDSWLFAQARPQLYHRNSSECMSSSNDSVSYAFRSLGRGSDGHSARRHA
jgi:hypothetical protein